MQQDTKWANTAFDEFKFEISISISPAVTGEINKLLYV